ncbi:MAG TPA: VUT family protein [Thermodesulforhabdus norvegica]|uniref:Probable queuosine precursor transporter n=1 Tax=Thermodesulforhabdus norvegica TaxID=39841 RepID=A0A7C0WUH3_9BACT|nr:queuosine precursor transporter [Deltaproteobacteria bacterium]MBW2067995.1 queuosine precursor transporter [Deltaproteobacteria bacterium]HDL89710.1 VUT family protein [Thermodesulforhabdus norvegica]
MRKFEDTLLYLTGLFVAIVVISNVIAGKLVQVGPFVVPIAVFCYPLSFAFTDIISEVYGKHVASRVIRVGFGASIILVLFSLLVVVYPPASFFEKNKAYVDVFGFTPRIVFASLLAYLASQTHDIWAFHLWKKKTKGHHLWLRNNLSTMASQFIDTAIFISVAFVGIFPEAVVFKMLVSQYLVKLFIAALDTPFVYLGVRLITGKWEIKESV